MTDAEQKAALWRVLCATLTPGLAGLVAFIMFLQWPAGADTATTKHPPSDTTPLEKKIDALRKTNTKLEEKVNRLQKELSEQPSRDVIGHVALSLSMLQSQAFLNGCNQSLGLTGDKKKAVKQAEKSGKTMGDLRLAYLAILSGMSEDSLVSTIRSTPDSAPTERLKKLSARQQKLLKEQIETLNSINGKHPIKPPLRSGPGSPGRHRRR